jgi:DNA repair protein RecN (Recombination protein N)
VLERLSITDFAVARSVTVAPCPGLNVFTGETGAGKSLVVDALAFVLGGRRGREVIAAGASRAVVEAVFALPDGRRLVIERALGLAGRSSIRIDGEPATLEELRARAGELAEIHGQSEQLAILRPQSQLAALDAFARAGEARGRLAVLVREHRAIGRKLAELTRDARERARLLEQLQFEVAEIAGAGLAPGEDEALRAQQSRLASATRLAEDAAASIAALEASPLGETVHAVEDIVARDPGAANLGDLAILLDTTAADLARALRRYRESIEDDPARLATISERLDVIARLRRKYGDTVQEILAYGDEAAARLAVIAGADESIEGLQARSSALLAAIAAEAGALSRQRRAAAGELAAALRKELAKLGVEGASLAAGFACEDDPDGPPLAFPDFEVIADGAPSPEADLVPRACGEWGVDRVEFLASFNPGEAPRPLGSIASGGETSRFLLALEAVLSGADEPRLVVLDEVDEGVGGRAGVLVGAALLRLAARHQVICITHLPQVAAFGHGHFVVSKQVSGGKTWSEIEQVEGESRVAELAAMLGGVSEANRAAARDLLATSTERHAPLGWAPKLAPAGLGSGEAVT